MAKDVAAKTPPYSEAAAFPPGIPAPHAARNWAKGLDATLNAKGLSYIAREKLPPGKFGKKWSADALARPPKPRKDCTYRDELAYASALNELEKKTSHNELIDEQIAAWWSDDGHDYFMVIISTMEKTQPGLVEQLKAKFVTDSGKYNGVGAMAYITRRQPLARR